RRHRLGGKAGQTDRFRGHWLGNRSGVFTQRLARHGAIGQQVGISVRHESEGERFWGKVAEVRLEERVKGVAEVIALDAEKPMALGPAQKTPHVGFQLNHGQAHLCAPFPLRCDLEERRTSQRAYENDARTTVDARAPVTRIRYWASL